MLQSPRPTVYIETYGCQMNVSDTELMLGKLTASGYESVEQPEGADVILINTCAIRDHAEQRVIGRLGEMKSRMKRDAVLGVTGCMAQRLGSQLLDRARHVSLVIGPDNYRDLPLLIESARSGLFFNYSWQWLPKTSVCFRSNWLASCCTNAQMKAAVHMI